MDCHQCKSNMQHYVENQLSAMEKLEMDEHLQYCEACQQYYEEWTTSNKLSLWRRLSPKAWITIAACFIVVVVILFASGVVEKATNWWGSMSVADQESLEDIRKFGIGNTLELSAESNDIKLTVTHAVADDIQTFIYYEIEDLTEDRLLRIDHTYEPTVTTNNTRYHTRTQSLQDISAEAPNQYRGRIAIRPLMDDESTINLEVHNLIEVEDVGAINYMVPKGRELQPVKGEWNISDIPVEKEMLVEKELDVEAEIAGRSVTFSKIVLAPTATYLEYKVRFEESIGTNFYIQFDSLQSEEASYSIEENIPFYDQYNMMDEDWLRQQVAFESMYYAPPETVEVAVNRLEQNIAVNEEFSFNLEEENQQSFTFLGTEFTVEEAQQRNPETLKLKYPWSENREFESISFEVITDPELPEVYLGGYSQEGIYMDVEGNTYDPDELTDHRIFLDEKIRYYSTESGIFIAQVDVEEEVRPVGIHINSYNKTTFPEEKVRIDLELE